MKKLLVIHPFLFAVYPILFLFSYNIKELSLSRLSLNIMLITIAITICFTFLLWSLLSIIFKDKKKGGLIASLLVLLFFSYGHFFNTIVGLAIEGFKIGRHRYCLFAWSILFTLGTYFVIKTRKNLHNFTNFLNIVATSLVLISLINIVAYKVKTRVAMQDNRSMENIEATPIDSEKVDILPDIYYIILDEYASSSVLKESYDYDNKELTDYLTDRGFYIASESRSNYAWTPLSLASSLNMKYINYLSDIVGIESSDPTILFQMIKDNRVIRFLKSQGYKFINFRSGWGPTSHNEYADWNVMCGWGDEFLWLLIQTTILNPVEWRFKFIRDDARERVLCAFSKLAEIHKIKGPKFILAHILCPHAPYLFGPNGEPITHTELKMTGTNRERYLDQLIFVNKKVKVLVDKILSEPDVLPIIILQSDHGSSSPELWDKTQLPSERALIERMRIFNAYYLPNNGKDLLYKSISPVNTFRVIFNFYFNTNYELLDDKNYFSGDWFTHGYPYRFVNVTNINE